MDMDLNRRLQYTDTDRRDERNDGSGQNGAALVPQSTRYDQQHEQNSSGGQSGGGSSNSDSTASSEAAGKCKQNANDMTRYFDERIKIIIETAISRRCCPEVNDLSQGYAFKLEARQQDISYHNEDKEIWYSSL